jgi:alkanesulfonate monooxygenase SsuD/methylene tetrahydromethanopterin reductase-like flavin-dependent oxidoreductase (luciferase family)
MTQKDLGIALRPELYSALQIVEYSKVLDRLGTLSHIFIPDIPGRLDSIALCNAALANTRRIKVGSGVIRIREHNIKSLQARIETMQAISDNRFVFGLGTGNPGQSPAEAIEAMLASLDEIRETFGNSTHYPQVRLDETFVAALRAGIVRKCLGHCTGFLLNFCSPEYAGKLVDKIHQEKESMPKFACYLKVFYAVDKDAAKKLLLKEFVNYDKIKTYHEMFVRDGISEAIADATEILKRNGRVEVPDKLYKISLANPSRDELSKYIEEFRRAGVGLPCVYPYFPLDDDGSHKLSIITSIGSLA